MPVAGVTRGADGPTASCRSCVESYFISCVAACPRCGVCVLSLYLIARGVDAKKEGRARLHVRGIGHRARTIN